MKNIVKKSKSIVLRRTEIEDLEFVINAERNKDNAQYIGQWSKDEHIDSLSNTDILHLIVEDANTSNPVGYLIIAGVENPNHNIEFRRIVISQKDKGFGKETLSLVRDLSFNELKAHRLWLDVRLKNTRAKHVYKSEGFKEEGILRECIFYNGEYESLIIMSILESEYRDIIKYRYV